MESSCKRIQESSLGTSFELRLLLLSDKQRAAAGKKGRLAERAEVRGSKYEGKTRKEKGDEGKEGERTKGTERN